ncbi:MAG: DUF192 domain-containing protein [Paracoccaceae bacterium]|nr:DUF192 domain-containing protein [Paracoccaceae bacterium]
MLFAQSATADECSFDKLTLRGDWGQAAFNVEIADTGEKRALGLMHRPSMPRQDGMLFVFDHPKAVGFWMRNTLIPLDMLFATDSGVITKIHQNAIPLDETPIYGGESIKYVLEINGGLSALFGITEGTQIRHPSIPAEKAEWGC